MIRICQSADGWWWVRLLCPCCGGRASAGVTAGAAVFGFRHQRKVAWLAESQRTPHLEHEANDANREKHRHGEGEQ